MRRPWNNRFLGIGFLGRRGAGKPAAPAFSVQPSISPAAPVVGNVVTIDEGTAGPAATLAIETFALDGADKRGELVGLTWDSTGESAGTISLRVSATNSGGTTLSDTITAELGEPGGTTVEDQTATFGALTVPADDDGVQLVDTDGNALTGVSDAGTGTATGYALSAGGVLTAASAGSLADQDGKTIGIASDQGDAVVTLAIVAGAYSCRCDQATIQTRAAALAGAVTATILVRDGAVIAVDDTQARLTLPYDFTGGRLTVQGETHRGAQMPGLSLANAVNITVTQMKLHRDRVGSDTTAAIAPVIGLDDSHGCEITDCEISSTALAGIAIRGDDGDVPLTDTLTLVHSGGGAARVFGLTMQGNYLHDGTRAYTLNGEDITISGDTIRDVVDSVGPFLTGGPAKNILVEDCDGLGVWARGGGKGLTGPNNPTGDPDLYPYDEGDPHSALIGWQLTPGGAHENIVFRRNRWVVGSARFDAKGDYQGFARFSGFDAQTGASIPGFVYENNVEVGNGSTANFSGFDSPIVRFNTYFKDRNAMEADDGDVIPLQIDECGGTSPQIQCNAGVCLEIGPTCTEAVHAGAYNNIYANFEAGNDALWSALWAGPWDTALTTESLLTRLAPAVGSVLLEAEKCGAIGTGYVDWAAKTLSLPSVTKPQTSLVTGVAMPLTAWDGVNNYLLGSDSTDPFADFANARKGTIALGFEITDPATKDMYLVFSSGALGLRRLPDPSSVDGGLGFTLDDAAGNAILNRYATRKKIAGDFTVFVVSWDLDRGIVQMLDGPDLDGGGQAFDMKVADANVNFNTLQVLSDNGSTRRMGGQFAFLLMHDDYMDLRSSAALAKWVAQDGLPADLGADGSGPFGVAPRIYVAGDAAALSVAGGTNLGSAAAPKMVVQGTISDVAAATYTPATLTFGSGVKVTAFNGGAGMTTGDEVLIAGRVTIPPAAQGDVGILVQAITNFALYLHDTGARYSLVWRPEATDGDSVGLSKDLLAYGSTISFIARSKLITATTSDTALIVDNGTPLTDANTIKADPATRDFKMPTAIHSMDGGTTADAGDLALTGGLIMFTGPAGGGLYDGIAWADLFDGSNLPKWQSGDPVNGFTPIFEQHTAAGFNAGTNNGSDAGFTTTGTVT